MITITIITRETKKGKKTEKKETKFFKELDKAKQFASPIAEHMRFCAKLNQTPDQEIFAVSYDEEYEKQMLIKIGAIRTNDNDDLFN